MSASALQESQLLSSFKSYNGVRLVRHTMTVWIAAVEIISEQKAYPTSGPHRKNDAGPPLISPNSDATMATQSHHEDTDRHPTEPTADVHCYSRAYLKLVNFVGIYGKLLVLNGSIVRNDTHVEERWIITHLMLLY